MKRKRSNQRKSRPISFRVYPEGSFLYCEVNIWPNKKTMQAHARLPGKRYEACCGGRESYKVPPKGRIRKTGLFAEANFNRHRIGVEIMSHELTHAAFAFAERRKLRLEETMDKSFTDAGARLTLPVDGPEERFCYALGQMCNQFTRKCFELGIYKLID